MAAMMWNMNGRDEYSQHAPMEFDQDGKLAAALSASMPPPPADMPCERCATIGTACTTCLQRGRGLPEMNELREIHDNKWNCRVPADQEQLSVLHEFCSWIPGAAHIRPRPDVIDEKMQYRATVEEFYASSSDAIFDLVFELPTRFGRRLSLSATKCSSPTSLHMMSRLARIIQ